MYNKQNGWLVQWIKEQFIKGNSKNIKRIVFPILFSLMLFGICFCSNPQSFLIYLFILLFILSFFQLFLLLDCIDKNKRKLSISSKNIITALLLTPYIIVIILFQWKLNLYLTLITIISGILFSSIYIFIDEFSERIKEIPELNEDKVGKLSLKDKIKKFINKVEEELNGK